MGGSIQAKRVPYGLDRDHARRAVAVLDGHATNRREQAMATWLAGLGLGGRRCEALGADASTRRYWRIDGIEGTRVVMDAPAQPASCAAFIRVRGLMAGAGLHVPRIEAVDSARGFMLLEDLGDTGYLQALAGERRDELLDDALDALVRWQAATRPGVLPPFDGARLDAELALFAQWYVQRHLGLAIDARWWRRWQAGSAALVDAVLAQPQVWTHRDFMARNLLVSDPNPALIDFQDALLGPVTYDIASLLRDAFISFEPAVEQYWIDAYFERARAAGIALPEDPRRAFALTAAQRHLKVLGVFARLCHRDGKPAYIADAPRFLGYLRDELQADPAFADFAELIAALPAPGPAVTA